MAGDFIKFYFHLLSITAIVIIMESGFTQHHSKGLFTFYREQDDYLRKGRHYLKSSLAVKEP
jgi:hypothetical protein